MKKKIDSLVLFFPREFHSYLDVSTRLKKLFLWNWIREIPASWKPFFFVTRALLMHTWCAQRPYRLQMLFTTVSSTLELSVPCRDKSTIYLAAKWLNVKCVHVVQSNYTRSNLNEIAVVLFVVLLSLRWRIMIIINNALIKNLIAICIIIELCKKDSAYLCSLLFDFFPIFFWCFGKKCAPFSILFSKCRVRACNSVSQDFFACRKFS